MNNREGVLELFRDNSTGWKDKVNAEIERNRKSTATLNITDANGNPIAGASVKAVHKNHEFRFGANCFILDGMENEEKLTQYKKHFADICNMATLPFYWDALEPIKGQPRYSKDSPSSYRRPAIDICIEFCEEYGIEPREHALAYDRTFPRWLSGAPTEVVKAEYERRCREIAERYADKIRTIEVTNEMCWGSGTTDFYKEPDYIEWCFKTARNYFPHNQLVINEWQALPWGQNCCTSDKYYSYIAENIKRGAPIDAIGMQYHMFSKPEKEHSFITSNRYYDPQNLIDHMNLYAQFGLPLQLTEVTIPAFSNDPYDEAIQAEIIDNLYRIWFSHPAVEQIIYWNLIDGYAAVDPFENPPEVIIRSKGDMTIGENVYYGGLLRFDCSPKPAFLKIKELLQKEWHTEAEMVTDSNGTAQFHGFHGDYQVQITYDGKVYDKTVKISQKGSNEIKITL